MRIATAICITAIIGYPAAVFAQLVRGTVSDGKNGVPGAIVLLTDSSGGQVARTLTDIAGQFAVRAKVGGVYRIRILRIGYRPYVGPSFQVKEDSTSVERVSVSAAPVRLDAIRIEDRSECRTDPESDSAALELWTEVRKALLSTVIAKEARELTVTLALFDRFEDAGSGHISSQHVRLEHGTAARTFFSLPAAELSQTGYAEQDATGVTYRAPDAEALLSEDFAGTHCWKAVASADDHTIGLSFEPALTRKGFVDIAGTLWLDRNSAELRSLDFRYTNVDKVFAEAGGGGRLRFVKLPSGAWIISWWQLRLPIIAVKQTPEGKLVGDPMTGLGLETGTTTLKRVSRIQAIGGAVLDVVERRSSRWSARLGSVAGTVKEAGDGLSIRGAWIKLNGTDYRAVTDSGGRFDLGGVLPGKYTVLYSDPVLDSIGAPVTRGPEVMISDAGSATLSLSLNSPKDVLSRICNAHGLGRGDSPELMLGTVLGPTGQLLGERRKVEISWYSYIKSTGADAGALIGEEHRFVATDSVGNFSVCPVPGGKLIHVDLEIPGGSTQRVDSFVTPMSRPYFHVRLVARSDSTEYWARVIGTLTDTSGKPVVGARITVRGSQVQAVTDSSGGFWLNGISGGHHEMDFRHLGFAPAAAALDISPGETLRASYQWPIAAVRLSPVLVRAEGRNLSNALADFQQRRRIGRGQFTTSAEFQRYAPKDIGDILRRMHSLRVEERDGATVAVSTRGVKVVAGVPVDCVLRVVVDHVLTEPTFSLDEIPVGDIAAVEVYEGPADVPAEFNGERGDTYCGLIVLWTRSS